MREIEDGLYCTRLPREANDMAIENTGAVVSRAAGVILLVIGGSSFLSWPWFEPSGLTTSGWTSYSPLSTNAVADAMTQLQNTYYVASSTAGIYLPNVAQALVGIVMLFSRPIGRWLARGLSDPESDPA